VAARLDRDTSLADLNGGEGIARGKITISDSTGKSATIDLSRAATVNDVLEAINSASSIDVQATVDSGRFILSSTTGANLTVSSAYGYDTAASLGIQTTSPASTVTGSVVYTLGEDTSLASLNDGNGVFRHSRTGVGNYDFSIRVTAADGSSDTTVQININDIYEMNGTTLEVQESKPSTLGGVIDRINTQLSDALGDSDVQISIGADGHHLRLVDAQGRTLEVAENPSLTGSTTAADLGLLTSGPQIGTVEGGRVLAGMNTTLARSLNGGTGVAGDGTIAITGRDGNVYNVSIGTNASLAEIVAEFSADTGGKITARLNHNGTGLEVVDATGGSASNLIISGDTATSLGIATDPAGVASGTVTGSNLQHQYITRATLLSGLRAGQGIGTGKFRITDSNGVPSTINIAESVKNVDDLLRTINGQSPRVHARINAHGDGIELYEDATGAGTLKIKVDEVEGSVAANLNLKGEATGTGADNVINGSFERTLTFDATDTLQQVATKITGAGVGIAASVINDGAGSAPYRLSLTARNTGSAGRLIVDTGAFDLGLTELDDGHDARVFFGATDPARAVLLSSSSNTLDSVITGVTIDLASVDPDPITLSITRDTSAVETAIDTFVSSFNTLIDTVNTQTKYDKDADTKAPLLGDSTALTLGSTMFSTLLRQPIGVAGDFDHLAEVGLNVGKGGVLELDHDRFRQALEQDPQGVADLFAAYVQAPQEPVQLEGGITYVDPDAPVVFTKLGVMGIFEQLGDSYINSVSGILTRRNNTITDQIASQNKRIEDMGILLQNKQERLQAQFLAMEEAIGKLQSQQGALSQIG
jgi:flagellar hook-associated protein 2